MSELLFIDMSMFVFTSVVPLTVCFIWARRHRSGHAYRVKRKQRERASPSCICVVVFIPNGILHDERRGYVMRQKRNEIKYVKSEHFDVRDSVIG